MDHFSFRDGQLCCEELRMADVAAKVGTPAYVYSAATLRHHYDAIAAAFAPVQPTICYSIKSCPNLHICRLLHDRGAGFDVVSGGELERAIRAGGEPEKIVFAGVGKTDAEIEAGINANIGWFNIESEAELENMIAIAKRMKRTVRAALRVNPDVDPKTHRYTTTGKKESKFGVDLERARRVFHEFGRDDSVRLAGIHLHLGSPVNTVEPYVSAIQKILTLISELRRDGFNIEMLDIGGGFGAHYRSDEAPNASDYAEQIVPLLLPHTHGPQRLHIYMEPGRSIAANAGVLLTRVLYLKKSGERDFLIVDAGMTELIRPALYEAYHFIWPVKPEPGFAIEDRGEDVRLPGLVPMDVVGPVCESGDFLAKDRLLPPMQRGDLVAVFTTGAYGMAMASHYNSRPNAAEVLIDGNAMRPIRRRETMDDLLAAES